MRPVRLLLIYFAVVFLGGALLAPWLFALAQWGAAHFPGWQNLAKNPFHRFVDRAILGLALICLWPFFRALGLRTWHDFGLANPRDHWRKIIFGFAVGFLSLACVVVLAISFGARKLNLEHADSELLRHLLNAGFAALLVPILEELIFRGALFGALRKVHSWQIALVISSVIYALVHFLSKPPSPASVDWASGLLLLPKMLRGSGELETLLPKFLTLTLAGMILGLAYQRTGNLFLSMGLHGGWIFWLKSYRYATAETPGNVRWICGSNELIDGWLALPILAVVFLILLRRPAPANVVVPI